MVAMNSQTASPERVDQRVVSRATGHPRGSAFGELAHLFDATVVDALNRRLFSASPVGVGLSSAGNAIELVIHRFSSPSNRLGIAGPQVFVPLVFAEIV